MTPTPREDTMAEQTEQEPMDPWARAKARIRGLVNHGAEICPQFTYRNEVQISCERCGYEADVHLVRDLLAARAADAAQVRERDAQIANMGANQLVLQEAVATQSDLIVTLRAERDAAQQQIARLRAENAAFTAAATVRVESAEAKIATLTEALTRLVTKLDVILPKVDSIIAFQTVRSGHQAYNGPNLIEELAAARAALQSTRPQEQP